MRKELLTDDLLPIIREGILKLLAALLSLREFVFYLLFVHAVLVHPSIMVSASFIS